jgi:enoyl-CoA hydratase
VALIRLNRPEALNALNSVLMGELAARCARMDTDDAVRAIVLTGSEKAFAAGADIKEMSDKGFAGCSGRICLPQRRTGFALAANRSSLRWRDSALGGGCELAMLCDFIIAADNARFGQPEIKLGVIAGIGGTQRLTRLIGRAKSMDMHLTGRMMGAEEAERSGLVARVVPADQLLPEAMKAARRHCRKVANGAVWPPKKLFTAPTRRPGRRRAV